MSSKPSASLTEKTSFSVIHLLYPICLRISVFHERSSTCTPGLIHVLLRFMHKDKNAQSIKTFTHAQGTHDVSGRSGFSGYEWKLKKNQEDLTYL